MNENELKGYLSAINAVVFSKLGSFVKEDLIMNNAIQKDKPEKYYLDILDIVYENKNVFEMERELVNYLKEN